MNKNNVLLKASNIHKKFPGVYALEGVNFELCAGEVHALVGENGAGKSTLIKIIGGVHSCQKGECIINDEKFKLKQPINSLNKGVSVIHQELNLFPNLSIAENIYLGNLPVNKWGRINWGELKDYTLEILEEVGLEDRNPKKKVKFLSIAEKQLIEVAKALSKDSNIIIMDEPTSSLNIEEANNLFKIIRNLAEKGVGIVYISHKLDEIFKLSDRVTVLRNGKKIDTRNTKEITRNELISMMVGQELKRNKYYSSNSSDKRVLEVKNLTTNKIKDISFYAKKGEIVGFSGLMGAGKTELAKALFGADKIQDGEILIKNTKVFANSTESFKNAGLGFVPENRKEEGIFPNITLKSNITVSSLGNISSIGLISKEKEKSRVKDIIKKLSIKTPSEDKLISKLSGGNQQKAILARWLIKDQLEAIIIDEPTRGIDVGAKKEIYDLLKELTKQGLAIVIMSSELPEILSICDRIYVMKEGKITAEFNQQEADKEKIMSKAI